MQKLSLTLLCALLSVVGVARAGEYDIKVIYSPKAGSECNSINDKHVYLQDKTSLRFRVMMNLSEKKSKQLIVNAKNYEVLIFSSKENNMIAPEGKPLGQIPFTRFVNNSMRSQSVLAYNINLKIPSYIRKAQLRDQSKIKYNNWNIIAVLKNKKTGAFEGLSSYSLRFIPKKLEYFRKLDGPTRFYSLEAKPESKLLDNTNGMETLVVDYYIESANMKGNERGTQKGFGGEFDLDSNYDFSIFDSYYYTFFNPDYHTYTSGFDDLSVSFAAYKSYTDRTYTIMEKSFMVLNYFEVLAGSSGVIYKQAHVEEADYEKFGTNSCGHLSYLGTERKSTVTFSYHLIEIDRTRYLEDLYLEDLGTEYLPTYDYTKK